MVRNIRRQLTLSWWIETTERCRYSRREIIYMEENKRGDIGNSEWRSEMKKKKMVDIVSNTYNMRHTIH